MSDARTGPGAGVLVTGPPSGPPAPSEAPTGGRARVRPWWGMGDALWMIPIMALVLVVSFVVIAVLAVIEGVSADELETLDSAALPASMLVVPTLIQQLVWFNWPLVVSKWKGLGPAADWGLAFKPIDIGIGLGTAMIAMFAAGIAAAITGAIVGLEDESLAENTQLLTDYRDSVWLYALLMLLVSGAPLAEEMLFRGLLLRSIEKRLGTVAGVAGSVVIFTVIHPADGGFLSSGQVVLWSAIAGYAVVLSVAAVLTQRLAASMIAHVIINALASLRALGHFDGLTDQLPT